MKFRLMRGIISIGMRHRAAGGGAPKLPYPYATANGLTGTGHKLNANIDAWLKAPDMQARWKEMGVTPLGGSTEVAAKFFASETVKWNRVIKAAGIRGD